MVIGWTPASPTLSQLLYGGQHMMSIPKPIVLGCFASSSGEVTCFEMKYPYPSKC